MSIHPSFSSFWYVCACTCFAHEQDASKKVQTKHTGFFANQGVIVTVGSAGHEPGKGGGNGHNGGGADGDVVVQKKKKVKVFPRTEAAHHRPGSSLIFRLAA